MEVEVIECVCAEGTAAYLHCPVHMPTLERVLAELTAIGGHVQPLGGFTGADNDEVAAKGHALVAIRSYGWDLLEIMRRTQCNELDQRLATHMITQLSIEAAESIYQRDTEK